MNPVPPGSPRRRVWRWVLLGVAICLSPFVVLGVVAASFLTLDRDAAALRKEVMAATNADWRTKVQLSVGHFTLAVVRTGLDFVHDRGVAEARLALAAVRHASVGVYERNAGVADWSREVLFTETDRTMARSGWARLAGVADHKDTVLVYVPRDIDDDGPINLCVAVVNGNELVVVSTSVEASRLVELAAMHAPDDIRRHLRLSRL